MSNHLDIIRYQPRGATMSNSSPFTGSTYTLQEIANTLGMTRERARQIEMTALKKLKHPKLRHQWENIIDTTHAMSDTNHKGVI